MNVFKKRIDELGRIVIPKQIRNNFKINNFDELEMFIEKDTIILKKSIGIEIYKEKLDRFLSFLYNIIDFKVIITDKNNVISSNYEGIEYRNELILELSNDKYVETSKLKGYVEVLPIIIDSNEIGKVYFISNTKIDSIELLKKLRNIIIDLIN